MNENAKCYESRRARGHFTKYLRGDGLDTSDLSEILGVEWGTVRGWNRDDGDPQFLDSLPDERFDFVFSSYYLAHVHNLRLTLRNWIRVLRPGGYLYLVVPDYLLYEKLNWPSLMNPGHKHSFSTTFRRSDVNRGNHYHIAEDLEPLLNQMGMDVVETALEDGGFNYNHGLADQTLGPALAQILIVAQRTASATASRRRGAPVLQTVVKTAAAVDAKWGASLTPPAAPKPATDQRGTEDEWRRRKVWALAIGNWGDVLACFGNALAADALPFGVLYAGPYPEITAWLRRQPGVAEVIEIQFPEGRTRTGEGSYQLLCEVACVQYRPAVEWLAWLVQDMGGLDIPLENIITTHIGASHSDHMIPQYFHRTVLDWTAHQWAESQLRSRRGPRRYLLHPISTESCPEDNAWPHWGAAINWLLAETPHLYFLTGYGWDGNRFGEHERLVNLVNQSPTMEHVFALAEQCDGVITTSNSLSMWGVVRQIPTLVSCNSHMNSYFTRWINREPVRPLHHSFSLETWQEWAEEFFYR